VLAAINAAVVAVCIVIAVLASTGANWQPVGLLVLVAALTLVAEFGAVWFPEEIAGSLASVSLALAVTFLGPAPAVILAVVPVTIESARWRIATGRSSARSPASS
jgi:hypothetical protein